MIDFAIFSCGRSGSTWTAAWLSKYASVLHDPAARYTYEEIQAWGEETEGFTGISCTAGWLYGWADRLRKDGVPVVKLYREASGDGGLAKVNRSFERVGLPPIPIHIYARFLELDASWHAFSKVVGEPEWAERLLGEILPGVEFDFAHWDEFSRMNIQPTEEVINEVREMVAAHEGANQ